MHFNFVFLAKVPYFFPWKSLRPLTPPISEIIIFVFRKPGEKNQLYLFFPRKSYIPLTQFFWMSLNKKKRENVFFLNAILTPFYVVFFLPEICFFLCIFFPENFSNFTYSLVSNIVFFTGIGKKRYTIFAQSLDFVQNCHKSKLFQEIKKIRSLNSLRKNSSPWEKKVV